MKHLFLLFSFILVASFSSNAQCSKSASAGKACCASKKTATSDVKSDTKVASFVMEADAAMVAANGAITKRTCEISGATSYYEKAVCSNSGKISWNEVQFDADKNSFTRVAAASMEKDANGNKVETKACAGSAAGKSCCKKDGAKACSSKKEGAK